MGGGEERKDRSYKKQNVTEPEVNSTTLLKEETSDIPVALYNPKREFRRKEQFWWEHIHEFHWI